MSELQRNPFKFGDPVEGEFYLPHQELSQTVRTFLENRIHVVLIGPRRYGKTSFVLDLTKSFEEKSVICLFVDIFNITSLRDFLQQMVRAVRKRQGWKGLAKNLLESIPKIRPKISTELDSLTGQSTFGMTLDQVEEKDVKEMIQDLLVGFDRMGDRVVVVLDEFQKIGEIDDQGWLEATLRTHMQQLKKTVFLLTGSRKRLIYDMLNNPDRPLFRSCQPIEFPVFGPDFTEWIEKRFESVGVKCQPNAIEHLREKVQDIPNYVQMVCFHLVAFGINNVTKNDINKTLNKVVKQNAYAYQTLLHSLTLIQQRALRLVANEGKELYSKEHLKKYEIGSGPALASALKSLKEKGILDDEVSKRGHIIFDDPLFSHWLKI